MTLTLNIQKYSHSRSNGRTICVTAPGICSGSLFQFNGDADYYSVSFEGRVEGASMPKQEAYEFLLNKFVESCERQESRGQTATRCLEDLTSLQVKDIFNEQ